MWNLYIMYYEIALKIFFYTVNYQATIKTKKKKKTHTQTKPSNISHPTCCGITDFKYPYSLYTFYLTKSFKLQKKEKKKSFTPISYESVVLFLNLTIIHGIHEKLLSILEPVKSIILFIQFCCSFNVTLESVIPTPHLVWPGSNKDQKFWVSKYQNIPKISAHHWRYLFNGNSFQCFCSNLNYNSYIFILVFLNERVGGGHSLKPIFYYYLTLGLF